MGLLIAVMFAALAAGPALALASFDASAYGRLEIAKNTGADVFFQASPFDDCATGIGIGEAARTVETAASDADLILRASASGAAGEAARRNSAALTDGYVFLSNPGESMAVVSFLFFYDLSSAITAGSFIEQAAAMASARIVPVAGAGAASFLKESYASGVFRSDIDMTAGTYGFEVALAPFQTTSLALYVDAMGYLDYAGYGAAEPPPLPAVPAPAADGLAALGLGALELLRRRKHRDRSTNR